MPKIQVYDARDKFAFECGDDEARALVSDGRAVRRYESALNESGERVYHLRLVTRLNAPNWIFGSGYIEKQRMPNGLMVHAQRRVARLIDCATEDIGEKVDHALSCLALDQESRVSDLPSKKAAAFVLNVVWGYTCREAGEALGIHYTVAADYIEDVKVAIRERIRSGA